MRPIASAKPNNPHVYVFGKRYYHCTTNSDQISELLSVVGSAIQISYQHAIENDWQILYHIIGERCWMYEEHQLSTTISIIRKNNPKKAKEIIDKINNNI